MTKQDKPRERRQFSRDFKLMALRLMESSGNVTATAAELGIRRELLYDWREKAAAGGAEALRSAGRPRPTPGAAPEGLAAEQRIAALERKVGEQALLIDFFKEALRHIEASRQASAKPGATASSPRSRR